MLALRPKPRGCSRAWLRHHIPIGPLYLRANSNWRQAFHLPKSAVLRAKGLEPALGATGAAMCMGSSVCFIAEGRRLTYTYRTAELFHLLL